MESPSLQEKLPTRNPRMMPIIRVLAIFMIGVFSGIGGFLGYQKLRKSDTKAFVTTYEQCLSAEGSRIQESYPQVCVTKGGLRFVQPTDDPLETPPDTDSLSCTADTQCVVGIQPAGCCACPQPVNQSQIGNNGWELYSPGKDYGNKSRCQTFMACAPCEAPSLPVVCRNETCTFNADKILPSESGYTCPESAWVDCMPGPLEGKTTGIRFQCTPQYLTWAKENCPGFQGAAY